jgi:hypothetical protein
VLLGARKYFGGPRTGKVREPLPYTVAVLKLKPLLCDPNCSYEWVKVFYFRQLKCNNKQQQQQQQHHNDNVCNLTHIRSQSFCQSFFHKFFNYEAPHPLPSLLSYEEGKKRHFLSQKSLFSPSFSSSQSYNVITN